MPTHPILIAGGGIAGLACALGLARHGREARVLERAGSFETVGAGLQIGPNAVRALKYIDVWNRVSPATFAPPGILIRDGHRGTILHKIDLGEEFERRFGEPYRVIHRGDLLSALIERARENTRIELRTRSEVMNFADRGSYVEVDARGGLQRGEALLGADGIRSLIRRSLGEETSPRRYEQLLFRALIPVAGALPEELAPITLWFCRHGHVVHYPVSGGRAINVVAAAEGPWQGEEWSAPADGQEVMVYFARLHPDLLHVLAASSLWQKWAAADLPSVASWTRNRATLVGDAAHAALPYLAQGAAMALEDAVVLARSAQRADSIASAFAAYEAVRKPRTLRIAETSLRMSQAYHAKGLMRIARNAALRMTSAAGFLDRMAWIYGFDPASA